MITYAETAMASSSPQIGVNDQYLETILGKSDSQIQCCGRLPFSGGWAGE